MLLHTEVNIKYVMVQCVCLSANAIWHRPVLVFTVIGGNSCVSTCIPPPEGESHN